MRTMEKWESQRDEYLIIYSIYLLDEGMQTHPFRGFASPNLPLVVSCNTLTAHLSPTIPTNNDLASLTSSMRRCRAISRATNWLELLTSWLRVRLSVRKCLTNSNQLGSFITWAEFEQNSIHSNSARWRL